MDLSEFDIDFLSQKLSDNPQSPLFARLADIYLSKNQASEALKLCETGVQTYSSYATGYVVLGKCYLALNENSKARLAFSQALHLAPFNQLARKLLDEIPFASEEPPVVPAEEEPSAPAPSVQEAAAGMIEVSPEFSALPESQETAAENLGVSPEFSALPGIQEPAAEMVEPTPEFSAFPEPSVQPIEIPAPERPAEEIPPTQVFENPPPQEVTPAGEPGALPGVEEYIQQKFDAVSAGELLSLDEYLAGAVPAPPSIPAPVPATAPLPPPGTDIDSIAAKLETAERITPPEPEPAPRKAESASLDSTVITPTLAEIYASQGEYGAAIQAYEILLLSKPGERERFEKRIKELQAKLFDGT